jgi:hypothetical protein
MNDPSDYLGASRFAWFGDLAPYLPPSILGSVIGLRWAQKQTPLQKVVSFIGSSALAVYAGPAIAEWFALGPRATALVVLIAAVIGMDVLGGLAAAARQFKDAPAASFKEWWRALRGAPRSDDRESGADDRATITPPKVPPHDP